jgi:hypothetical protein
VDTPIPPRRVLGRHPQDQAPQLRWNRRPTGRAVWHGPVASDQLAMPAQQGLRCHEPMVSTLGGEQSGQRREHGAVWPGGAWAGDLTAQDRDLMSEYEDFGVLGRLLAGQQREPAEELAEDEVEESQRHDWRSSRTSSPCYEADFTDLGEVEQRLLGFQRRYQQTAVPFDWRFTRSDLDQLLRRLDETEQLTKAA